MKELKLEEIKAGDKVIAVENKGDIMAIIIVKVVTDRAAETINFRFFSKDFTFYPCPKGLTLDPTVDYGSHRNYITLGEVDNWKHLCIDGDVYLMYDTLYKSKIVQTPKKMTVAEVSKALGYEIEIVKG